MSIALAPGPSPSCEGTPIMPMIAAMFITAWLVLRLLVLVGIPAVIVTRLAVAAGSRARPAAGNRPPAARTLAPAHLEAPCPQPPTWPTSTSTWATASTRPGSRRSTTRGRRSALTRTAGRSTPG